MYFVEIIIILIITLDSTFFHCSQRVCFLSAQCRGLAHAQAHLSRGPARSVIHMSQGALLNCKLCKYFTASFKKFWVASHFK